jgi:hypothetical protein
MSEQAIIAESPKHPGGRPSIYGPIVTGKLIGAFQLGLSVSTACDIAGIDPDTMYDWMKKYPEFSEKITAARTYGKVLAAQTVQDVLQDVTRGKVDPKTGKMEKQKYSETTRVTTARWWLEKTEKEVFGSQSTIAAKVESDGKGGVTTTIVHTTDGTFTDFFQQVRDNTGGEEINPGQLLEILEGSPEGEGTAGGGSEEPAPPVHPEELQGEHTTEESLPQP